MTFDITQHELAETIKEIGPDPGDDPIARLQHTVSIYSKDRRTSFGTWAVTATHNRYAVGKTTGLTFGDLAALEEAIRKDEREKTAATLERSGHVR